MKIRLQQLVKCSRRCSWEVDDDFVTFGYFPLDRLYWCRGTAVLIIIIITVIIIFIAGLEISER